ATRSLRGRLGVGPGLPRVLAWGPGGRCVGVVCADGMFRLLAVDSGEQRLCLPAPPGVRQVVFAPDDLLLGMAGRAHAELWGRPRHTAGWDLVRHVGGEVRCVAFSRCQRWLALAYANEVELWSTEDSVPVALWSWQREGTTAVPSVAFTEDGRSVIA